ncbi:uncharacterized protein BKCO1_7800024 [Diplodia corticola]|uniref:Uncharacterized protein n=1 Tax=Diplodia corticola TaxID=236234 RepID=A0A1J9RAV5_9PEZI|nr:uncharacterized protein BKCO1_7800024 [Diplodia corticola]OJD29555.1 hypothetical protein BKCO1_7800024 [Diplodia corticola]
MTRPVGLVQLHFRPGSRFSDVDAPVKQLLVNITESFENGNGYIFAGPHLDDPEKAVVMICYGEETDEAAARAALNPSSSIYAPIAPYLQAAPRADVVSFTWPPPTTYGQRRERVQELALIRIPARQRTADDDGDDENDDDHDRHDCRGLTNASDDDDDDETTVKNKENDDDDDHSKKPIDDKPSSKEEEDDDDDDDEEEEEEEEELFFSPSPSPSSSPTTAAPLRALDDFFSTALCSNAHRGLGDLATHSQGRSSNSSRRDNNNDDDDDDDDKHPSVVLHAWSWADEGAMRRFKDAGAANAYDRWERRRLDDGVRGEAGRKEEEEEEEEEEADDLWQTGFVGAVEELRRGGAEVEVVAARMRHFQPVLGALSYGDE